MFETFSRETVRSEIGINTVVGGSGDPVLLLHGYPQNLAMWARVAPLLARDYTVVCTDLRGYGDSDTPAQDDDLANYSFRRMAHDQVDVMRFGDSWRRWGIPPKAEGDQCGADMRVSGWSRLRRLLRRRHVRRRIAPRPVRARRIRSG